MKRLLIVLGLVIALCYGISNAGFQNGGTSGLPAGTTVDGTSISFPGPVVTTTIELTKTDAITDCSGFSATGGGLFYDDSEGKFKKCQDNVLTDMDTAGSGYTNLTEFVGQTAWRVFYSDGSGDVKELALGTDGQYLKSNGATSAPTFDTPAAAHDAVTLNANITPTELLTLTGQDIALATQTANYGLFGPTSGAAAAPGFRAMVNADIPTTLTPQVTRIGVGQAADGTNLIASPGFSVDPEGNLVAKKLTSTRVAGAASVSDYYEVPANGDSKVSLKAPDSLAADYVATLPSATGTLAITSGALGTPSFTALNMPSANADPGTTAGQISHDSTDTASSSGGTLKWYDGAQVRSVVDTGTNYTKITKYEYMPIRYAEDDDSVTAPAAAAEINTSSTMIGRSFAEDADNGVVFWWQVPSDYVSGIKYRVYYAVDTNASADETVAFGLSGCSVGNSDAIACSEGTAVNVTDELSTDEDVGELIVTGWSTEVTVTNAAAGELAKLLFIRDVSEDDAAGHTLVTGIEIKYVGKISPFGDY